MNLSDLLNVELYNDSLRMFNQETLQALGNVLDEHVLENLYERHAKKSTLMKYWMTLHQQTLFRKRSREATRD